MKFYLTHFLAIFLTATIVGQNNFCYDPPSFNFGGLKTELSFLIQDNDMGYTCQGIEYDRDRGDMWVAPIEYDDRYIISMSTGFYSGSLLIAIEKNTNKILWQKKYNHLNEKEKRGFGIAYLKKLGGDSLELITNRSYNEWEGYDLPQAGRTGLAGRRVISYKTGEILTDYWIGDKVEIKGSSINNFRNWINLGESEYPLLLPNTNIYHALAPVLRAGNGFTEAFGHLYADASTLLRIIEVPPNPVLKDIEAPIIQLNRRGINNSLPDQGWYDFKGPIIVNDSITKYLFRYRLDGKARTSLMTTDRFGNFINELDITSKVNADDSNFYWEATKSWRIGPNRFRLQGGTRYDSLFEPFGHQGYVDIDLEGNLIKDQKSLAFDGLRPLMMATTYLSKSNSSLHIFRPIENNNIYFYEEYQDGTYRKAGELINPNRKIFAPFPEKIWINDDGSIFVNIGVRLDSVWAEGNFALGAWQGLIMVSAENLGLISNTTDQSTSATANLYPNPTTGICYLSGITAQASVSVRGIDGRSYYMGKYNDSAGIDLSTAPNGLYVVTITTGQKTETMKVVKN